MLWAGAANAQPLVDVALVLAADTSFSIGRSETEIQRDGYVAALRTPELSAAITNGPHGRIALTYLEWSGPDNQRQIMPWQVVQSRADLLRFADALEAVSLKGGESTSISAALDTALNVLQAAPVRATRHVIDLSSDGINNAGPSLRDVQARAAAMGVTINGLPVLDDAAMELPVDLIAYFEACIKTGPGAFVMPVRSWSDFEKAFLRKLLLEVSGMMPDRLYLATTSPPVDCLIGEKLERDNYLQQLDSITGGQSDRWKPREEDWKTPE